MHVYSASSHNADSRICIQKVIALVMWARVTLSPVSWQRWPAHRTDRYSTFVTFLSGREKRLLQCASFSTLLLCNTYFFKIAILTAYSQGSITCYLHNYSYIIQ